MHSQPADQICHTEPKEEPSPKKPSRSVVSQQRHRFNEQEIADYKEKAKAHFDRSKYPLDHRKRALTGMLLSGNHGSMKN